MPYTICHTNITTEAVSVHSCMVRMHTHLHYVSVIVDIPSLEESIEGHNGPSVLLPPCIKIPVLLAVHRWSGPRICKAVLWSTFQSCRDLHSVNQHHVATSQHLWPSSDG